MHNAKSEVESFPYIGTPLTVPRGVQKHVGWSRQKTMWDPTLKFKSKYNQVPVPRNIA